MIRFWFFPNLSDIAEDCEETLLRGAFKATCGVCQTQKPKYTCPRCTIQYCSQACYVDDRHGKDCSEAFFQDQVRGAIGKLMKLSIFCAYSLMYLLILVLLFYRLRIIYRR